MDGLECQAGHEGYGQMWPGGSGVRQDRTLHNVSESHTRDPGSVNTFLRSPPVKSKKDLT